MSSDNPRTDDRLLEALAEQLKLPFLQISQHAEFAKSGHEIQPEYIETLADMALRLIDGYILGRQASLGQLQLNLEPVSVSAVLHDSAEKLSRIAREYKCDINLHLSGKYAPVMADRRALEAALTSLGFSMIEAQRQHPVQKAKIVLAAHKGKRGIVAGAFGANDELTSDIFRSSKLLYGRAKQSVPELSHGPSAGVFVADSLFRTMSSRLKVAHHARLTGLAATLVQSPQLRIVEV